MDYQELFGEMVDMIVTKKIIPDKYIETMTDSELKALALEKNRKGLATDRAKMAQEVLYERTHTI